MLQSSPGWSFGVAAQSVAISLDAPEIVPGAATTRVMKTGLSVYLLYQDEATFGE
jgi:hypothetical protein